jgi:uncharacterized protein (DUF1800 family)
MKLTAIFLNVILISFYSNSIAQHQAIQFPYKSAGLTDREAAAHLLNRLSFGADAGAIDYVLKVGLEEWYREQLKGNMKESKLDPMLSAYPSLKLSYSQILHTYPKGGQVFKQATSEGKIVRDTMGKKDKRREIKAYMDDQGYKPQSELIGDLISAKILRAAYSENQLREVLADFWFNHFNVSLTKPDVRPFVTGFERDVIRPNVFGKFKTLLIETAKSPAMLAYLDNAKSSSVRDYSNPSVKMQEERMNSLGMDSQKLNVNEKIKKPRAQGLNENYAREVMELHTLGVNSGYTQSDVTQAARILTGWSIRRRNPGNGMEISNDKQKIKSREGEFIFLAGKHDFDEKKVLGVVYPKGVGYQEGENFLNFLAEHPATANFISSKLARRFVSDNPPESLIKKMAAKFLETDGDIAQVMTEMVTAPEFWSAKSVRKKTKSPFELAIGSIRAMDVEINNPYPLYQWITKMGQKLYYYQAPTGFPDNARHWINSGALLNRMNFGLALASGRIRGTKVNLGVQGKTKNTEQLDQILKDYCERLLPEQDSDAGFKKLLTILNDPELMKQLHASSQNSPANSMQDEQLQSIKPGKGKKKQSEVNMNYPRKTSVQASVVGLIIGSPEYQNK